jgi:fibronectin-binding autotransporter adhesin
MRTLTLPLRSFLVAAACLTTATVSAATVTWDTSATAGFQSGNGIWGTDAFWSADGVTLAGWTAGDSALFLGGATKVTETITLTGAQSIGGLTFGSVFTSGAWTFAGTGTMNLAAATNIDVVAGSSANLADRVLNSGFNITKTGAGTLRLNSGTTTNIAKVTVNAGVLELVGTGVEASGLGNTYTLNNGTTLALRSGGIWLGGNGPAITLNQGSVMTTNGLFNRLSNLTFNGGNLDINGFTGTASTFLSAQLNGTLNVNQDSRIFASSGVGQMRVGGSALTVNVATGATLSVDVNLATGGGGVITKNGLGQLTLNGSSVHPDQVVLNAGTLTLGHGQALGTGLLTINAGTLNLNSVTVANTMAFKAGSINVGDGIAAAWNGVISTAVSGTAAFSKTGNGQLTLGGTNTYTTGTTLSAGTLLLANNNALGTGGVTINGGALDLGSRTIANNVTLNSGSMLGGALDVSQLTLNAGTVGVSLSGSSGLNKVGAGSASLTAANTYTGATTIAGGSLTTVAGALAGTSSISVNAGTLDAVDANPVATLSVGTQGSATFASTSMTLAAVTNDGTLAFSGNNGNVTLLGLSGTGTTTFAGDANVSGNISGGVVNVTNRLTASVTGGTVTAGSLSLATVSGGTVTSSGTSSIATLSGGTAYFNGTTASINTLSGGLVNLGATELTVQSGSFAGSITGNTGSLVKAGATTLTLSGVNSYGGGTAVNAGTLVVGSSNALGTGQLTVNAGATLSIGQGVTVNNQVFLSGSTSLSGDAASINGGISGNGSLTKVGAGTLTLEGVNAHTGGTIVQGGGLQVNGSLAGVVTVQANTSLNGTGSIAGTVTVLSGGTLGAGGVGVGGINLGGLDLRGGSTLELKLADQAGQAGLAFDAFHLSGDLSLASVTAADRVILHLKGAPANFNPATSMQFAFLDYHGLNLGTSGDISSLFTINTSGLLDRNGNSVNPALFTLVNDTTSKQLSLAYAAPVPEASTYGLCLGALGLGVALVRRRRTKVG